VYLTQRRLRMILCEAKLKGWQRADYVVALLTTEPRLLDGIQLTDVVEAVNAVQSFADCQRYLQKDCEICYTTFPTSQVCFNSNKKTLFESPFVKMFALCCWIVICLSVSLSVCLVALVYCCQMVGSRCHLVWR